MIPNYALETRGFGKHETVKFKKFQIFSHHCFVTWIYQQSRAHSNVCHKPFASLHLTLLPPFDYYFLTTALISNSHFRHLVSSFQFGLVLCTVNSDICAFSRRFCRYHFTVCHNSRMDYTLSGRVWVCTLEECFEVQSVRVCIRVCVWE